MRRRNRAVVMSRIYRLPIGWVAQIKVRPNPTSDSKKQTKNDKNPQPSTALALAAGATS